MPLIRSPGHGAGRRWLAAALAVTALALTQQAWAACTLASNYVAQDVEMDMGTVVILPSTPVGGVIKQLSVPITQRDAIITCGRNATDTALGRYYNAAQQTAVAGFSNVYATDVAGVGIRLYRDSGTIQTYYPHTISLTANTNYSLNGGYFRIELIKTAATTGSGSIAPSGRFTTYYLSSTGTSRPILTSTFKGAGTTVVSPTCAVQAGSKNIVVDFGTVANTTFTGVGSRAVNRDFAIKLDCQGSNLAQYQSTVGISLAATQDSSNLPGVLAIATGSNAATRIGIELMDMRSGSEASLQFGQTLDIGSTTLGSNTLSLPLRARYIQTQAGRVGAGDANGTATFTIEYN